MGPTEEVQRLARADHQRQALTMTAVRICDDCEKREDESCRGGIEEREGEVDDGGLCEGRGEKQ